MEHTGIPRYRSATRVNTEPFYLFCITFSTISASTPSCSDYCVHILTDHVSMGSGWNGNEAVAGAVSQAYARWLHRRYFSHRTAGAYRFAARFPRLAYPYMVYISTPRKLSLKDNKLGYRQNHSRISEATRRDETKLQVEGPRDAPGQLKTS